MQVEDVNTVIVGGGQAGIAMSEHLGNHGISHVVLEKDRIAERWRTGRWDSLVANGPAWHDRFPNMEFDNVAPDAFAPKDAVADYFAAYAEKIGAPVRTGVEVTEARRLPGEQSFRVETTGGLFTARNIVAATGPFQRPSIPGILPEGTGFTQLHSATYRNPDQLPAGNVLVVGAGSSGVQIATEIMRSGRQVYLSVGAHNRPPRRYRGVDFVWWLGVLGKWEAQQVEKGKEHVTIAVSGAVGGETVDFRKLADEGMTLVGQTLAYDDGVMRFAPDLGENIARGDRDYLSVLDEADAYAAANGLDLPEDPDARHIGPDPDCVRNPLGELDLKAAGVTNILWATGYKVDFGWLKADCFDETGKPVHQRGVSSEPGVFFLGLPWLARRGSSFIWGVWHDAKFIADQIAIQRDYMSYYDRRRAGLTPQASG
jgi:putative flavoprotein involved in K+ transport